jgi:pimeloyl-ACP methyl ester carboxylesterase
MAKGEFMSMDIRFQQDQLTLVTALTALTDLELTTRQAAPFQITAPFVPDWQVSFSSGVDPAHAWSNSPPEGHIIICGASSASMFASVAQGPTLPIVSTAVGGIMATLTGPADRILRQFLGVKQYCPPSVVITGHSYGGSLALVIAAELLALFPGTKVQCLTLGSFRPGDSSLDAALAGATVYRLMNAHDPIPRFPPTFTEAPLMTFNLGYRLLTLFQSFVQAGPGWILNPDGTETPSGLPLLAYPIQDLTLLTWLVGVNGLASYEHNYRTYLNNLNNGAPYAIPAPPVGPIANLKGDIIINVPQAIFNLGPVQGPAALLQQEAIVQSVYIPANHRMKVVRAINSYQVQWEGFTFLTGQGKSNAKTFAKAGNKLLRVMQSTSSVSRSGFVNALNAYLSACGSGTAGFQPVLSVLV